MAKSSISFKAVILAGGSGERFWPLSTPERPKQFLRVFGPESLIRQSVSRLKGLAKSEDIFVVTSRDLVEVTRRELPELPAGNIVGEPMRRDTGAAVALGVGKAQSGVIGFFPSDQLVADAVRFRATLRKAIRLAAAQPKIVTLGIKPDRPATGFGYIDPKTKRFVEKPDLETARRYLGEGYLWNAGMFIARAETFRLAFETCARDLTRLLDGPDGDLDATYEALPKISFDYAVMERFDGIDVVPGDFGWDDVGSYTAFDTYFPHDAQGNVREGPCTVVDAESNICVARGARIALLGVKDLVVVTTKDAVLVADKSKLSDMKRLFR